MLPTLTVTGGIGFASDGWNGMDVVLIPVYTANYLGTQNDKPEFVYQALARRSVEAEEKVRQAYAATLQPQFALGLALVAVGGFGRGELFPHSDVDLLLLFGPDSPVPRPEMLAAFLRVLRDAGFRPAHTVRTIEDCITRHADNAELTMCLLDRRLLAGDAALYRLLEDGFRAFAANSAAAIASQLVGLAEGRRARFQNTIYHLQPNVKDAPGGLRDLHTVRWLQMLKPREGAPDISAAFDFLAALRIRLHELAGREQNVLSFEAQDALSAHPAELMGDYYRHTRLVDRAVRQAIEAATEKRGTMLARFHEWRSGLSNSDYTVSRDQVFLRAQQLPRGLNLFEFVARHGLRPAPGLVKRLQGFVPEAKWEDWKRLLSLPRASVGLRAMQEAGVMTAALPEWRNIECLVLRDFYHRYPVDEHTLDAVASLESVPAGPFQELFGEVADPAAVRFALLLHDLGSNAVKTDHTEESLEIAAGVLLRLDAPEAVRSTVEFLIRHHLDLSAAMSSRDLHDGTTARMLADGAGTIERLKMLAMLTYGDLSAANPQAMTPFRMEQLWQVYVLAREALSRESGTERVNNIRAVPPDRARFLEGLPARYVRLHTQAEITAHFEMAQLLAMRPVAVEIRPERGYFRLTLLTGDRPKLFAAVAGAISSFGLNILKAEAFSNSAGILVDTFTFSDPHRTLELNPTEVDRLEQVVRQVVEGKQDASQLLSDRPKPFRSTRIQLEPAVTVKNDASEAATLVEIVAEDRPGLLHDLASAISRAGCNIEVVIIDTKAHKAIDVFYVTSQGNKLDQALEARLKADLLAACVAA